MAANFEDHANAFKNGGQTQAQSKALSPWSSGARDEHDFQRNIL
jgi:hypothetical protein